MNVIELKGIADWIEKEIVGEEILNLYQELNRILSQNAKQNQQQQPFEEQRNLLTLKLKQVGLSRLSIDQLSFLDEVGMAEHLGAAAATAVEDNLVRNGLDVATAAATIQVSIKAISSGIERAQRINEALTGCTLEETEIGDGILVRVGFVSGASIGNVVDFKDWAKVWHKIGYGIATAHGETAEDFRVIGAGKGSVIIELAVSYQIAKTVGKIILWALEVTERVGKIRNQALVARNLSLQNDKIAADLEKEADLEKTNGADSISDKLIVEMELERGNDNVIITSLKMSVENLLDFLDKGGDLDCIVPDEDDESSDDEQREQQRLELRESFVKIRELKSEQKLLGGGSDV